MNKELEPTYIKQWVSLPIGSMALRVGSGVLDSFSAEMRVAVGHPERCVITYSTSVPDDIVELLTHDLTTIGFTVKKYPMPDGDQATSYTYWSQLVIRESYQVHRLWQTRGAEAFLLRWCRLIWRRQHCLACSQEH